MTLPTGRVSAAVERAIELVAALESLPSNADHRQMTRATVAVLERWNDQVDDTFADQFEGVVAVIREIGRFIETADPEEAATAINEWLATAASAPRLVHEPGWGWHLHADPVDADWATWLSASSALAFAVALADHARPVWGRCAATGCRRPFLDHGRRSPQQFCSPSCATRERVRRHRAPT